MWRFTLQCSLPLSLPRSEELSFINHPAQLYFILSVCTYSISFESFFLVNISQY